MKTHGVDTETVNGNLKLVCTEDRSLEPQTFEEIARFLTTGDGSKLYWSFNLQFDAETMIKLLPFNQWMPLYRRGKIDYNGYRITYFPKRLFNIGRLDHKGRSGRSAKIYDAAQYYIGENLNSASEKYLGENKIKLAGDESYGEKLGAEGAKDFYAEKRDDIIRYCKHDSYLAMELGKHIMGVFDELSFPTRNPISCATISGTYVSKNYKYPGTDMLPGVYHGLAQASYRGGMFQTLQRGYFEEQLYDYDINSAYPSVMVTLPHWANGKFDIIEEPTDAPYGWYMCEFDCPMIPYDSKKSWTFAQKIEQVEMEFTAKNHRIYYPSGSRKQVITKVEYEFMKRHNYPCEFLFGCEWTQTKQEYESPFAWMESFYYERQKQKKAGNYSIQYAMKIILNGLYGKTAQMKPKAGKLTNFFYSSYITAVTRLRLAEILQEYPNDVVNIATDGLISREKIPELELGTKLGQWESNEYTKGLFIGSGLYQVWNEDESFITKARGITDRRNWNMLEAIEERKQFDTLEFTKKRPLHLGEILIQHEKLKPEWLGVFMNVTKKMNVNTDRNHKWDRAYEDFNDLLENNTNAEPMIVTEI